MEHVEPARCKLCSLRIERFKSFKNPVVINLKDSMFTSIVGPNGAGKSSVVDAVNFVFGATVAPCGLAKLVNEDCLCEAAQSHTGVTSTVAVHIEASGVGGDAPSRHTISRTIHVHASGATRSEYEVDGTRRSQVEVHAFLGNSFGIDIKNPTRFILMQSQALSLVRQGPTQVSPASLLVLLFATPLKDPGSAICCLLHLCCVPPPH